jgi:hypothetical protein
MSLILCISSIAVFIGIFAILLQDQLDLLDQWLDPAERRVWLVSQVPYLVHQDHCLQVGAQIFIGETIRNYFSLSADVVVDWLSLEINLLLL